MSTTTNSAKVISAVGSLAQVIQGVIAVKGNFLTKIESISLLSVVADVEALVGVDYSAMIAEIKGLDAAGIAALEADIAAQFPAGKTAAEVLAGLELALQWEQLIVATVAYAKTL